MKKRGSHTKQGYRYVSFLRKVSGYTWFFPAILVAILLILTALKISGTSIGIYHNYLYGTSIKDSNLLYGRPQSVRSDEWLVVTQMTIAQEKNGYAHINYNFNDAKDMSLVVDAPYLDWSALFKPQNFSFFVLPFEYAFAFKWWFLLVALILSAYYFALRLLGGKIFVSIMIALIIGFAPFVFWWYQSSTIAALAYGFLILLVGMSIIDRTKITIMQKSFGNWSSAALKSLTFAYLLSGFALLLYPPFQIPIALVIAFFLLGYLLNTARKDLRKYWLIIFAPFVGAVVLTTAICGAFLLTRAEAVHAISNTVYPGKRIVASGGYSAKKLLVTYLQPQLQRGAHGAKYAMNQSESSSFILMPLFFILPAIVLLGWLYVRHKKIEWVLFCLVLVTILFLINLFVGGSDPLTKLFLLSLVPHERLIIGLGFLSIVLVAYMIRVVAKNLTIGKKAMVGLSLYTIGFFGLSLWAGFATSTVYSGFISNPILITLFASGLYLGLGLLLINKTRLGLLLIALFSIGSVFWIHPLYRGLGPIYNSEMSTTIQELSTKKDVWGAADNILIENVPQMSGRMAVTGVSAYPNNDFWKEYADAGSDSVYNRYAHTILSPNDASSLILVAPDLFAISNSCSRKVSQKIDYIVSTAPITDQCTKLLKTIKYPNLTVYFYRQ